MTFAILAAVIEFIYIVGTRRFLALKKHVNYKTFLLVLFIALFLGSLAFWPSFGHVNASFLSLKYILIFIALIVVAVLWNLLYYRGLHEEKLVEFELITMVYPLATIILASIFLPQEFDLQIFFAGIIATLALIFSHIKYHHLRFNKIEKKLLWTVVLMAIESILVRYLLEVMSPLSLYCVRTGVMLAVFLVIFRKEVKLIKSNIYLVYQIVLAIFGIGFMVFEFEAYTRIGVSFTILVLLLTPVLTFLWAHFKEKESFPIKKMLAAAVIIAAIIYAYLGQ